MVCEEYLIYNFIIFKENFYRCNLKIYLIDNSIMYIKFIDTTILFFNIKKKLYTTQFKNFYFYKEFKFNLISIRTLINKRLSIKIESKEDIRFIYKKINTIVLEVR